MKSECDEIRGILHEVISNSRLMDEYGDANNLEEPVWEGSNLQRCEEDPNEMLMNMKVAQNAASYLFLFTFIFFYELFLFT